MRCIMANGIVPQGKGGYLAIIKLCTLIYTTCRKIKFIFGLEFVLTTKPSEINQSKTSNVKERCDI